MVQKNITNVPEWMKSDLSIEEMYSKAVAEAEKKIEENVIIAGSNKDTLAYWRSSWCTESLFYYLFIGGERALAELRAATYPMPIAYSIRETGYWKKIGLFKKEWQAFYTPYIFMMSAYSSKEKRNDYSIVKRKYILKDKAKYPSLTFFYMNCDHRLLAMEKSADIIDVYDERKFKTQKSYEKSVESMWAKLKKKDTWYIKQCRFLDIKTNKEQCVFVKTGVEEFDSKNRHAGIIEVKNDGIMRTEVLNADGTWLQTYDITDFRNNPNMSFEDYINSIFTPEQQKTIKNRGKMAIIKLNETIFSTENMKKHTIKININPKNGKEIRLKHSEFYDEYLPKEMTDAYNCL